MKDNSILVKTNAIEMMPESLRAILLEEKSQKIMRINAPIPIMA